MFILLLAAVLASGWNISSEQEEQGGTASGPIEILEQDSFKSGDQIVLHGVVRNNSDENIDIAIASGNAYDDQGEVIGLGTDELKKIGTGEKAPFEILIDVDGLGSIEWHCTAEV